MKQLHIGRTARRTNFLGLRIGNLELGNPDLVTWIEGLKNSGSDMSAG